MFAKSIPYGGKVWFLDHALGVFTGKPLKRRDSFGSYLCVNLVFVANLSVLCQH